MKIIFSCSGMFLNVPCSGFLRTPVHLIVILCLNVFVLFFMLMVNKRVGVRGMSEEWEWEIEKREIVVSVHTVLKIG